MKTLLGAASLPGGRLEYSSPDIRAGISASHCTAGIFLCQYFGAKAKMANLLQS
jgi:hypothetical protein